MKKLYSSLLLYGFATGLLLCSQQGKAQCVNGDTGSKTAYDTTIRFPTGMTNKVVKFPKFNPQSGMVTCVKLIVNIIGIVDSVAMQNYSGSVQDANFYYNRNDFMSGPGLAPSISNNFSGAYGPYSLDAYDGIASAGPDFRAVSKDTVLKQQMTRTLTDSMEISQFYGAPGDSVAYNYNINVSTSAVITGGSNSSLVLTSALVNFRFEYCTCPMAALPLGLKNFSATRQGASTAGLRWDAEAANDHYYYEVEVSRDGHRFSKVAVINKQTGPQNPSYQYGYTLSSNNHGRYYFRVKQQWVDGYYRYSEVRPVDFSSSLSSSVSLYPNPSNGQVGLKFVAAKAGLYAVQVSNSGGQIVYTKQLQAAETDLKQLTGLQKGLYYVKITEVASGNSFVQQLVVQ